MQVYTCPLCGRFADTDGRLFTTVAAVSDHIDAVDDQEHQDCIRDAYEMAIAETVHDLTIGDLAGTTGPTVTVEDEQPVVTIDGETLPLATLFERLEERLERVQTTVQRITQEQQDDIETVRERLSAHQLAIQELQAGVEELATEHKHEVEYQFKL